MTGGNWEGLADHNLEQHSPSDLRVRQCVIPSLPLSTEHAAAL